ncbi:hypothetical protein L6164_012816 [Bauhinia variegata]|uniref:Uncharacterized protein n=1 Tax=Bauhinia variegata TaxID=167791 RepID=A0ACB9PBI8_BAUVA|nr:hypothetical protein L6164_012816 [Bauhinia variegata]
MSPPRSQLHTALASTVSDISRTRTRGHLPDIPYDRKGSQSYCPRLSTPTRVTSQNDPIMASVQPPSR